MITIRPAAERGHFNHGWLDTYHSFSFADYWDPKHMGYRSLRVINEDKVAPHQGFGTHPHRDMEIITYVLEGSLAHKDSMGTGSVIRPGEVQRMSAGTGVLHSEFNNSPSELVHLLQIWIQPDRRGLTPSYEQKNFSTEEKLNRFRLIASPTGEEGSVTIHQDAKLSAAIIEKGNTVKYELGKDRSAWIQVACGEVTLNGKPLKQGDGAAVENEAAIMVAGSGDESEVLLFDLA
jgi:quercetin 2,3-dioxygenase